MVLLTTNVLQEMDVTRGLIRKINVILTLIHGFIIAGVINWEFSFCLISVKNYTNLRYGWWINWNKGSLNQKIINQFNTTFVQGQFMLTIGA